jgi:hypothetical protein
MESYDRFDRGTRVVDNGLGTVTTSEVNSGRVTLTVNSQVLNGNFKTPNPYNYVREQLSYGRGSQVVRSGNGTQLVVQTTRGTLDSFAPNHIDGSLSDHTLRLEHDSLRKLYEQLRGETSNLIIDVAEAHLTLRMLKSALSVKKIAREYIKSITRSTPRGFRGWTLESRAQFYSSKWLEYRYGWLPCVYSAYDALDTLSKTLPDGFVLVKGSAKSFSEKSTKTGTGTQSNPTILTKSVSAWRLKRLFIFELEPGLSLYDWTSLNPFAIAWELTPLSFVADWFFTVSEVLEMYQDYWRFRNQFRSGVNIWSYRRDTFQTREGWTDLPIQYNPTGTVKIGSYGGGTRNYVAKRRTTHHSRTILTSLPLPVRPQLRVNLNAKRLADAAALIKVILLRKGR